MVPAAPKKLSVYGSTNPLFNYKKHIVIDLLEHTQVFHFSYGHVWGFSNRAALQDTVSSISEWAYKSMKGFPELMMDPFLKISFY